LRLIYLLKTPELLQLLHIIRSNNHIRIAKALSVVLIVWMLGASVYFLVCHMALFSHHHHHQF